MSGPSRSARARAQPTSACCRWSGEPKDRPPRLGQPGADQCVGDQWPEPVGAVVAGVEREPGDGPLLSARGPRRQQRCLAAACRCADQGQRKVCSLVEPVEQSLALDMRFGRSRCIEPDVSKRIPRARAGSCGWGLHRRDHVTHRGTAQAWGHHPQRVSPGGALGQTRTRPGSPDEPHEVRERRRSHLRRPGPPGRPECRSRRHRRRGRCPTSGAVPPTVAVARPNVIAIPVGSCRDREALGEMGADDHGAQRHADQDIGTEQQDPRTVGRHQVERHDQHAQRRRAGEHHRAASHPVRQRSEKRRDRGSDDQSPYCAAQRHRESVRMFAGQVCGQVHEPHVEGRREDRNEHEPGANGPGVIAPDPTQRQGAPILDDARCCGVVQAQAHVEADQSQRECSQERKAASPTTRGRPRTGRRRPTRRPRCHSRSPARRWRCASLRTCPNGWGAPTPRGG